MEWMGPEADLDAVKKRKKLLKEIQVF